MESNCIMANATGGGRAIYPEHWKVAPFAVIRTSYGRKLTLCKEHLDRWLDIADNQPDTEPMGLWFL